MDAQAQIAWNRTGKSWFDENVSIKDLVQFFGNIHSAIKDNLAKKRRHDHWNKNNN